MFRRLRVGGIVPGVAGFLHGADVAVQTTSATPARQPQVKKDAEHHVADLIEGRISRQNLEVERLIDLLLRDQAPGDKHEDDGDRCTYFGLFQATFLLTD